MSTNRSRSRTIGLGVTLAVAAMACGGGGDGGGDGNGLEQEIVGRWRVKRIVIPAEGGGTFTLTDVNTTVTMEGQQVSARTDAVVQFTAAMAWTVRNVVYVNDQVADDDTDAGTWSVEPGQTLVMVTTTVQPTATEVFVVGGSGDRRTITKKNDARNVTAETPHEIDVERLP